MNQQQLISVRTCKIKKLNFNKGYITIDQEINDNVRHWEFLRKFTYSEFISLTETLLGISNINPDTCEQQINALLPDDYLFVIDAHDNSRLIAIADPYIREFFYFETGEVLNFEKVFYSFKSKEEKILAEKIQEYSNKLIEVSKCELPEI